MIELEAVIASTVKDIWTISLDHTDDTLITYCLSVKLSFSLKVFSDFHSISISTQQRVQNSSGHVTTTELINNFRSN